MLETDLVFAHDCFVPGPDTRWPAPSIAVGYLEPAAMRAPRVRDSLDILVPTGSANLFATFRGSKGAERTALVRAPLVSVVPPGLPHALADQPGDRTLVLGIARAVFDEAVRAALDGAEPALAEPHAATDPLLRQMAEAVEADMRAQRSLDPRYLDSLAAVLAAHVARHYAVRAAAGSAPAGLAPHKLQRVDEFIARHLDEPLRVEELARVAHLSPFHFARMFKQSTGQSPHLYVLMQRIERARQLLADTEAALAEVAAEVGFRTQGHFTGVFHRYTGSTPRAFRLSARADAPASHPGTSAGSARLRHPGRQP